MDWGIAIGLSLAGVAVGYGALAVHHHSAARVMFLLSAGILLYKTVDWGMTTNLSPSLRIVIVAILGAAVAVGLVEGLIFANQGSKTLPASIGLQPTTVPSPGVAKDKAALGHSEKTEIAPPKTTDASVGTPAKPQTVNPTPPARVTPIPAATQRDGNETKAGERAAILSKLTNLYILSHDGISPRMAAGMELPSADFLNAELERQGVKWRVRSVNGPNAETYDIP